MEEQVVEDLCELIGYRKGKLPFHYLGVPITAKRLNTINCEMLVDEMITKVRTWGLRNLSYVVRVQLVNSVLMNMHTYWSSIFLLPKKVLKDITSVCRNFIWNGQINSRKPPVIAWDIMCKPKDKGGIGFINCMIWNEAAIAKYVWNISKKADNLWVKWVNHVYLKGVDWWQYKPPQDSCWYWKKIYNVKEKYANGFRGNGWLKPDGIYTVSSGYKWKQQEGQKKNWWRVVWNTTNIPKHSFIFWMVMH